MYIENPQPSYKPGDTIRGRVFRQVPVLVGAEDVKVTIELTGSVSAKLTELSDHFGESQRSYTSCVHLFSGTGTLQTLHHGPLHIPRMVSGLANDELGLQGYEEDIGQSWPFCVTIPSHTSASWVREDTKCPSPRHGFIPIEEDGRVAIHPLPSSLGLGRLECGPGAFLSGGVSYFLKAHLISVHANSRPRVEVQINIQNHQLATRYSTNTEPHISESTIIYGKRFHNKGYEVLFKIETPSTYIVDQRGPLNFVIRAMWPSPPNMDKAKPPGKEPIIRVNTFIINLVEIIAIGVLRSDRDFTERSHRRIYPIHRTTWLGEQDRDQICIPFGLQSESLDLGQTLGIQMHNPRSRCEGGRNAPPLPRGFRTFNIKRTYELAWEIVLDIADENLRLEGRRGIALL